MKQSIVLLIPLFAAATITAQQHPDSGFERLAPATGETMADRGAIGLRDRKPANSEPSEFTAPSDSVTAVAMGERKLARTDVSRDELDLNSEDRPRDLVPLADLPETARWRLEARHNARFARGDNREANAFDPRAVMATPAYGQTLDAQQLFSWQAGYAAQEYWLWVGSCFDCTDIFDGSTGLERSRRINIPRDGRRIYVSLFTFSQGLWWWHDLEYNAPGAVTRDPAAIHTPAPGSTLTSTQTFSWTRGTNVSSYWLWVGSCRDCTDLLDSDMGLSTSYAARIPTDGRAIYVTLFSLIGGNWHWFDYTYTAPRTNSGGGNQVSLVVTNKLSRAINITVNGSVVGSVPAYETRTHETRASGIDLSWDLERVSVGGRLIGDPMGGVFQHIPNPSGRITFTVNNRIGDSGYFNPWITNNTANALWMEVNGGLNSQNRCDCSAPAGSQRVSLGYYKLFSNSNVRGFRNSNYTGQYSYWGTDANGNVGGRRIPEIVEADSGITRLNAQ